MTTAVTPFFPNRVNPKTPAGRSSYCGETLKRFSMKRSMRIGFRRIRVEAVLSQLVAAHVVDLAAVKYGAFGWPIGAERLHFLSLPFFSSSFCFTNSSRSSALIFLSSMCGTQGQMSDRPARFALFLLSGADIHLAQIFNFDFEDARDFHQHLVRRVTASQFDIRDECR